MPQPDQRKIAYLFGAGATNAELSNIGVDLDQQGLLISNVTRRVTIKAKENPQFLEHHRIFLERAADSSNIELFISLIEDNAQDIPQAVTVVEKLKEMVEEDIRSILTPERVSEFYLHKSLFELHKHNESEQIIGLISLNYDTVLDKAYESFYGEPDYNLATQRGDIGEPKPPLLKLHGSFSWDAVVINGRPRKIPIIPMGINKDYLRLPYSFIWGRALEVLAACDVLRVIGCSLSQNDVQLVDLLFKAHLERGAALEIQIISSEETGQEIRGRYDFFPKIVTAEKIEETLLPDAKRGTNVFKEWLRAKGRKVLKEDERIQATEFIKKVIL